MKSTDLDEVLENILASINDFSTSSFSTTAAPTTSSSTTPAPITTPPASSNSSRLWTVTLDVDVPFSPADVTLLVFARDFLHLLSHTHFLLNAGHHHLL